MRDAGRRDAAPRTASEGTAMNIPLYWVRATAQVPGPSDRRFDLTAWGWSSVGRAEAEQKAHERLASLDDRSALGVSPR